PAQIRIPLVLWKFGRLMIHIGCGVAIQQKDTSLRIIVAHVAAPGAIAVDAVQHRSRIGSDLIERSQLAAEIGSDQRRGIFLIVWELDLTHLFAGLLGALTQQFYLRTLSAAVQTFDNNQFPLHTGSVLS